MTRREPRPEYDHLTERSNWISLRTLLRLRWLAVAGQTVTILIAWFVFDIQFSPRLCLLLVALSASVNVVAARSFPENRRLQQHEVLAILLYDCIQLGGLLFLTGGLNNPFALLILAPATVAATGLGGRPTAIVIGLTVAIVTLLWHFCLPLRTAGGVEIVLPPLFDLGFWLALVIGVVFVALNVRRVSAELNAMSQALLATETVLAREHMLTGLSGVVAAAAHELGTPLATIKLTSSELVAELEDRPALRTDAELIRDQANRCSEILRSMGRAGMEDLHMRAAPFLTLVQEAAEPHSGRREQLIFYTLGSGLAAQPLVQRRPEVIHGLRNLVQNAVDFADSRVSIALDWDSRILSIAIADDGPGFPPDMMGRLGDPFVRARATAPGPGLRPHYEGMGLGLFIARTLLERTGASVRFGNRAPDGGAVVTVTWARGAIEAPSAHAIGKNQPIVR